MTMTASQDNPAMDMSASELRGGKRRLNADVIRQLCRRPKGLIGLVLICGYVIIAFFGPWLAPYDPLAQNFMATLKSPSASHWFGTDQLGRDVFSRILVGAHLSLGIGVGGVSIAFVLGVPLGLLAAWYRGMPDRIITRAVDIMLSFPDIVSALAIVAILGAKTQNVILAVGLSSVPVFVRTTRAVAMSVMSEPFIEGSRSLGCRPERIIVRHVLPNMAGTLLTLSSLLFASTLLAASGLSFLGLGVQPPAPEWGGMLGDSRSYIRSNPYLATFPGLSLAIAALAFNLLGEELRGIFDPTASKVARRFYVMKRFGKRGRLKGGNVPDTSLSVVSNVDDSSIIARAENLHVAYLTADGPVDAIRGVSLELQAGRTLAIVGESGSGKSTLLRAVATLLPQRRAFISGGRLRVANRDIAQLNDRDMRNLRRTEIGVVFQDAAVALNPMQTVGKQLVEAITVGQKISRNAARAQAVALLRAVQIADPEQRLDMHPHEFSGGMKQRIVIAIALAQQPSMLLADEPTSALDVTVQQQILKLLRQIQQDRNMAMMLVTHDLGLVARYADDVAVMYAGEIVESGTVDDVFQNPRHPYTRALKQSSITISSDTSRRRLSAIGGEPPQLGGLIQGCNFAPRCSRAAASPLCTIEAPLLRTVDGRKVACHLADRETA